MLSIGLILYLVKPGETPDSFGNTKAWAEHLVTQGNFAEASISFAIACLTVLGFFCWLTYTAYGLSAFPIGIIKGRKHISEEVSGLYTGLESAREEANAIKSKYLGGKQMSKKDSDRLELLKRKERFSHNILVMLSYFIL